jgi:hypothetical protein
MIEASAASTGGPRGGNAKAEPESESDSDEEEDDGEEKEEKKEGGEKKKEVNRGGKLSGLRKVRLGAFEDTGRCKGSVIFSSLPSSLICFQRTPPVIAFADIQIRIPRFPISRAGHSGTLKQGKQVLHEPKTNLTSEFHFPCLISVTSARSYHSR